MLHEHPLELADIKAGVAERLPPTALRSARRQLVYYPIAAVVAAGLLFAVYGFVRAASRQPSQRSRRRLATVPVFVPQTPTPLPPTPTPLPSPTAAPTSEGTAGPASRDHVGRGRADLRGRVHHVSQRGPGEQRTCPGQFCGGDEGRAETAP